MFWLAGFLMIVSACCAIAALAFLLTMPPNATDYDGLAEALRVVAWRWFGGGVIGTAAAVAWLLFLNS